MYVTTKLYYKITISQAQKKGAAVKQLLISFLGLVDNIIKALTLRAEIKADNHREYSHQLFLAYLADNGKIAKYSRQQNGND